MAFVVGREPSSSATIRASSRATRVPDPSSLGFVCRSQISLPTEYMITHGWLRSVRTHARTSRSCHMSNMLVYPLARLPADPILRHSSKTSSFTRMPSSSQSSSSPSSGGLCDDRIAFTPASLKRTSLRLCAARFHAAPRTPKSWCIETPFSGTVRPFSWKRRSSELNAIVRMP